MPFLMDLKRTDLISEAYRQEQIRLHAQPRGYGHRGRKWADVVQFLIEQYRASSVLDFGAGTGSLVETLRARERDLSGVRFDEYDPAVPGKDVLPRGFADLVTVTDVLEHVEPDKLSTVLEYLHVVARKAVFVVISLQDTNDRLADGSTTHLTIQPSEWWIQRLTSAKFTLLPPPAVSRKHPEKEFVAVLEQMP
jgi:Methyltransferase domain